ncbi:hypothetical protein [Pendulispora albinea]|uniref:Metalloprotease n=1 Tax=Pendulispora albinea TaxID=2741071 RepID=A0ABZ2LQJ3_9BACT
MNKSVIRGVIGAVAVAAMGLTSAAAIGSPASSREISFMPQNSLDQEDNLLAPTGITEAEFNRVINYYKGIYTPIVSRLGGRLVINNRWTDNTVNANASQSGTTWTVNMFGGLARRPEITSDGFAIVLCHEIGHHLGGYFFYSSTNWASAEGQSDWYATQVCARNGWVNETAVNATFRNTAPAIVKQKCDAEWKTTASQDLCYRISVAGKSTADLLAALGGGTVRYETPDTTVVSATQTAHPRAQCRLDTYFTGALCTVQGDINNIPGKSRPNRNSVDAERDAAKVRCLPASVGVPGYNGKNVPTCWFRPQVRAGGLLDVDDATESTESVAPEGDTYN